MDALVGEAGGFGDRAHGDAVVVSGGDRVLEVGAGLFGVRAGVADGLQEVVGHAAVVTST